MAFFDVAKEVLAKFLEEKGVVMPAGSILLDYVFRAVMLVLDCTEAFALECCRHRRALSRRKRRWAKEIGLVEEPADLLEREDKEVLNKERKKNFKTAADEVITLEQYQARYRQQNPRAPKGKGKGGRKGK